MMTALQFVTTYIKSCFWMFRGLIRMSATASKRSSLFPPTVPNGKTLINAFSELPLEDVKGIAKATKVTVTVVLYAILSCSLRKRFLEESGKTSTDKTIATAFTVSVRQRPITGLLRLVNFHNNDHSNMLGVFDICRDETQDVQGKTTSHK